jgi:Secretion system C-terminal sorting domain
MKHCVYMLLCLAVLLSVSLYAADTVYVASDALGSSGGNLNTAVTTAITAGTLSNTVFKLDPYGYYILTGTITVPLAQKLIIVAPDPGNTQETAPAQILWTASSSVTKNFNFDCFGDVYMKNIQLMYGTTGNVQVGCSFEIEDDSLQNLSGLGENAAFENVIFDYSCCPSNGSGSIGVSASHFRGKFINCYFRNCVDPHYRYYGRAVSFPYNTTGYHGDSLTFENCTFANLGYGVMQEAAEYNDYVKINHCTMVNTIQFAVESGWWKNLSITNSVFVNTFMFGDIPLSRGDTSYPGSGTSTPNNYPNGGVLNIDSVSTFGFTPNFSETDRHIYFANTSYCVEPWLVTYYKSNAYTDTAMPANKVYPQPMMSTKTQKFFNGVDGGGHKLFPNMTSEHLYPWSYPNFGNPPLSQQPLKDFLLKKWTTNADMDWSWNISDDFILTWPMNEDLSYANDTLNTAGMGGYPLGDLYHWYPAKYTTWKSSQKSTEDVLVNTKMNGTTAVEQSPVGVVAKFELSQNYPNPFNPTTQISYSVARSGHISLKVYDVLGREVASLVEGVKPVGSYIATFNAGNLSSGVYFYRLQADGNSSITKKLLLMK